MRILVDNDKCVPYKKHTEDAGFDLVNARDKVTILPYGEELIHTGVHIEIDTGYCGILVPRSSMGKAGLSLVNTFGVIDSSYRGEIMAICRNNNGNAKIDIEQYQRFVQLMIVPVYIGALHVVDELSESERGHGGFGSTGKL